MKFGIDEVTVIRVVCRHCDVATEAPVGQFGQVLTDGDCPTCKKSLLPTNANGRKNLLKEPEDALMRLAGVKNDEGWNSCCRPRRPEDRENMKNGGAVILWCETGRDPCPTPGG